MLLRPIFDGIIANLSIVLSFYIRFAGFPHENFEAYQQVWIFITIVPMLCFYFLGAYYRRKKVSLVELFYNSFLTSLLATGVNVILTFYFRAFALPRTLIIINILIHGLLSFGIHSIFQYWIFKHSLPVKMVVYGYSDKCIELIRDILDSSSSEYNLTVVTRDCNENTGLENVTFVENPHNTSDFMQWLDANPAEVLLIAMSSEDFNETLKICFYAWEKNLDVKIFPDVYEVFLGNNRIQQIAGIPVLEVIQTPYSPWQAFVKRMFDIFVSLFSLIILFPVIAFVSLLIKMDSKGPVFFRQRRVGKNSREFDIVKFRTMIDNAEANVGPVFASENDQRVTRLGKFLRKTRLDEVPQFFNVLSGNMSLIGPRPERKVFLEQFGEKYPMFYFRTMIKPGITGLAQVHGKYDTTPENKLKYDLAYITGWSFLLDLKIVFWTFKVIFTGKGAR